MDSGEERLDFISRVIAEEFHKANFLGGCLASSFILYEESKRFGLDVEVVCGSYTCKDLYVNLHFCCQYEGNLYDPSRLLTVKKFNFDIKDFTFHQGHHSVTNAEQSLMMGAYEEFCGTESVEEYFKSSPMNLQEVRRKVHERISEYIDLNGASSGPSTSQI